MLSAVARGILAAPAQAAYSLRVFSKITFLFREALKREKIYDGLCQSATITGTSGSTGTMNRTAKWHLVFSILSFVTQM